MREPAGPWLSTRGNCRNTAWTPALGPRTTPRVAWRWRIEGDPGKYDHIRGGPAVDRSGIVYVGTSLGLVALNDDGARRWTLGQDAAAAPALDREGNIVSAFAERLLIASPVGNATWHESADLAAQAVTVADDGAIYVAGSSFGSLDGGRLTAFGPDYRRVWAIKTIRGVDFPPAISPSGLAFLASHDSIVWNYEDVSVGYDRFQVLSADGKQLECYDRNDEGYGSVWGATAAMCLEDGTPIIGIGDGMRVGAATLAHKGSGVPAVDPGGTLYVPGRGIEAIDLASGREKWRCAAAFELPIVDGGGTVYAANQSTIVAISPDGAVAWSWTAPEVDERYFGSVASLAIGPERTLYVTTLSEVIALRE